MARIVVYSNAYRGDVYPFVPIASELTRRGHDVTFVCPREFHPAFAAEPFKVAHSGSDSLAPKSLDEHGEWLAKWGMRFGGALQLRLFLKKLCVPFLDDFFDALSAEVEGADLLISHPAAALVGSIVAEAHDVPWIGGDLFPMLIPTATRPPHPLPDLGPRGNKALWNFGRSRAFAPLTSENDFLDFRRKKGVDATRKSSLDAMRSPHLNLGMASPHYVEPAADWPDTFQMTGFSLWNGPDLGAVPDDVTAFLDAGEKPVLVTLGTSAATAAPDRFSMILRELDRLGQRGLFLTSTEPIARSLRAIDPANRHGIWPFVPLAGVLDRCRGAVQSGAHGTNAMLLAAGVPSVISPVLFDQVWHGERQEELGTGVFAKKPKHIAKALEKMLGDRAMSATAWRFAELIADEDGVGAASDAVEGFLASK